VDATAIGIISVATFINFASVKVKFDKHRYSDAVLDLGIFAAISFMFSGTITGLTIGMISSALLSIYLWFSPPKEFFTFKEKSNNKTQTAKTIKSGNEMGEGALEALFQGLEDIKRGI